MHDQISVIRNYVIQESDYAVSRTERCKKTAAFKDHRIGYVELIGGRLPFHYLHCLSVELISVVK
jgi:hypothetical protein